MRWDLRLGDWRETLADVEHVDAVIVDAPYSARTHDGHDRAVSGSGNIMKRAINYSGWTADDVRAFVDSWAPRCRGWFVTITDHELAPVWADALEDAGRYVFAPLPWVAKGSRVRLAGDGPSCWTCWIVVARPRTREAAKWGTLPGAYVINAERASHIGGKPLALMEALIRDYTRPGDLVCDPCAGYGTTLAAAIRNGREAIGSELDPVTHEQAMQSIAKRGRALDLFSSPAAAEYLSDLFKGDR